jgi:hypothetical protein
MHYFMMDSDETIGEFNDVRNAISVRIDHSLILRHAIEGVDANQMRVLERLGFCADDFKTRFAELDRSWPRILSFWVDAQKVVYRHRSTGLLVPFDLRGAGISRQHRGGLDPNSAVAIALPAPAREALRFISEEFEFIGDMPEDEHAKTLEVIFEALPEGAKVFVLKTPELKTTETKPSSIERLNELNRRIEAAAGRHPDKVELISVSGLVDAEDDTGKAHLHRKAYYQMYRVLSAKIDGLETESGDRVEELAAE